MSHLLRKPFGSHGEVHRITPQSAGWRYVGFSLYRLRAGETAAEATGATEAILVLVEGKARMEAQKWCDSLLVTEVFTPAGNWSSYPSHRHDEDDFPRITYLEETYYHRLNPKDGWAVQRVYTDDGALDVCMAVKDGDVVLVPRGHHPCGGPAGQARAIMRVNAQARKEGMQPSAAPAAARPAPSAAAPGKARPARAHPPEPPPRRC